MSVEIDVNMKLRDVEMFLANLPPEQKDELFREWQQAKEEQKKYNAELVHSYEIVFKRYVSRMENTGWTMPLNMSMKDINVLGQLEDKFDFDAFFLEYFTYDNGKHLRTLIDTVKSITLPSSYLSVAFEESISAFESEKYTTTAVLLAMIIEGMLNQFQNDKTNTRMKELCKDQIKIAEQSHEVFVKCVWESYYDFVKSMYKWAHFDKQPPNNINRHWLLHGRYEFPLCKTDCLKLFNAVNTLSCISDIKGS